MVEELIEGFLISQEDHFNGYAVPNNRICNEYTEHKKFSFFKLL